MVVGAYLPEVSDIRYAPMRCCLRVVIIEASELCLVDSDRCCGGSYRCRCKYWDVLFPRVNSDRRISLVQMKIHGYPMIGRQYQADTKG